MTTRILNCFKLICSLNCFGSASNTYKRQNYKGKKRNGKQNMIAPLIIVSWSIGEMLLDIARTHCSNVSQVEVELSEERPNCKHGSTSSKRPTPTRKDMAEKEACERGS